MPGRAVAAGRLRRRLTIAFIAVAALSAGALAAGSFLLVRQSRLQDSLDRAAGQTRLNLTLATALTPDQPFEQFVRTYETERGIPAVLLTGTDRISSNPELRLDVPDDLRRIVAGGEIGFRRMTIGGSPFLVTGGPVPSLGPDAQMYFLFSEAGIHEDLSLLGTVLLAGVGAVVIAAGLAGRAVARRTLQPVASASLAARSIAEGLLQTRLPVESRDEFGAWAASFNEMAEALESKIAALTEAQARERRFTSDVAHELRTPLTALVSAASLLREQIDAMPDQARRPAELLVADVARLRRLVEELMEISRLDAGRETLRPEPIDIASLVEATVRARGWDGRVRLHSETTLLSTDRRRLERVVGNLVGNAVEHGGRDVTVRVGRDATGAFVEVTDRGRGIAPEHLPHLFDRFYKVDPSRTGSGSGLGLAIALENARLLGGDIDVWSEPGEGTRFTLRLPVTEPLRGGEGAVSNGTEDEAIHR